MGDLTSFICLVVIDCCVTLVAKINRAESSTFQSLRVYLAEPKEVRTDVYLVGFVSVRPYPSKRFALCELVPTQLDGLDDVRHLFLSRE